MHDPHTDPHESHVDLLELLEKEHARAGLSLNPERYEVLDEIARGMGVIIKVRDRGFRRELAMKVLPQDPRDPESGLDSQRSSRFLEEAQVTGQLEHPGVVPVYEFGLDEERRLFFTMRLVKGMTLGDVFDRVREGREGWTTTRALGILLKVCETMAFAHDKGVIHRDLKPANVMVGRFGETYVMDWGLAKVLGKVRPERRAPEASMRTVLTTARKEGSGDSSMETLEGDVMGTPAYMPPEQARGELERLGSHSDIYSIGAILYHLLAGKAPFTGESEAAIAILERLHAGPPEPLEEVAPEAAPELVAVCEKAMARDPGDRYASMLALADDLHAYLDDRVVRAYRTGAVVELKKWVRRNRGLAASLALAMVFALAGLGGISFVQARARADVEAKNQELAETNIDLEEERSRTAVARDAAVTSEELARTNELAALANAKEALWQSYVGNLGGALASLNIGSASEARRRLAACPEDLRDWEWRYLNQRAHGSRDVLGDSPTFLYALDVHPGDTLVAAAGGNFGDSGKRDFAVRIWDYRSGALRHTLSGHGSSVVSLSFSPGGDVLASSDLEGRLRIWDVATGDLVVAPEEALGSATAYHANGRHVIVADYDRATSGREPGFLYLWDTYEERISASRAIGAASNAVCSSPDGSVLAAAGIDHRVRLFDGETLEPLGELDASGDHGREEFTRGNSVLGPGVFSLDFSPEGQRLVTGSSDGFVRIWDLETRQRIGFFTGHGCRVFSVRWHPYANSILSSDENGTIRFWDADTGETLEVLRGHDGEVFALGLSELGERLLSASRDTSVRVWDGQAGTTNTILEGVAIPNYQPYALAFSEDGTRVAWRRALGEMRVTDVRTGEDLCVLPVEESIGAVREVRFRGEELLVVSGDGDLQRWDAQTGELLSALQSGLGCSQAAISPAGDRVALSWLHLSVLDTTSGEVLWKVVLETDVWGSDFSSDGAQLFAGTRSGMLHAWDASTGEELWRQEHPGQLHGLRVHPADEWIVTTTYNVWDDTIFFWDAATGEPLARHVGHAQPSIMDVSPDGARVVTGNWDGTVSLWSPRRGEVLTLPAHLGIVADVGFSPDGGSFASLGSDGRAGLWTAIPVEDRGDVRTAAARRRRWKEDAQRRVERLFTTHLHRSAVAQAVQADDSLERDQRDAAVLAARNWSESQEDLIRRSYQVTAQRDRTPALRLRALEAARIAVDRDPANGFAHVALGGAQLRMGLYPEALASLEGATTLLRGEPFLLSPTLPFLRALVHDHLDQKSEAVDALAEGRRTLAEGVPGQSWTSEREEYARALQREAEERIR